jgi:hypothetical protein
MKPMIARDLIFAHRAAFERLVVCHVAPVSLQYVRVFELETERRTLATYFGGIATRPLIITL